MPINLFLKPCTVVHVHIIRGHYSQIRQCLLQCPAYFSLLIVPNCVTLRVLQWPEWQLFYVAGYLIEERRRWPIITASPRGQCSK